MVIAAPFTPESPVVLVVDDDDKLASLIGRMLDRAGYDCVLAPTGDEALRAMRCCVADLVGLICGVARGRSTPAEWGSTPAERCVPARPLSPGR